MSENYLADAFKALDILDEDVFKLDSDDGISKLQDFVNDDMDAEEMPEPIIDPEADTEDELKDSYIGKVILDCNICHSMQYKNADEVIICEDGECANIDEECPYCHSMDGYTIIGQVASFNPAGEDEEHDESHDEMDDEETGDEIESDDIQDESLKEAKKDESLWDKLYDDLFYDGTVDSKLSYSRPYDEHDYWGSQRDGDKYNFGVRATTEDKLNPAIEIFKKHGINDYKIVKDWDGSFILKGVVEESLTEGRLDAIKARHKKVFKECDGAENVNESRLSQIKAKHAKVFGDLKEENLKEDFKNVEIETDESKMTMTSEPNGKVVVTTEPVSAPMESEPTEMIAPLSDDTLTDIESNSEEVNNDLDNNDEYQDADFDEFSEDEFDEIGESYLRRVYENVESYKTTKASQNGNKLKLEGVIKFKSGKNAKTNFTFESYSITKRGKYKFIGENAQLSKNKKAFTLTGNINNNKFIAESLTYNYSAKDSTGSNKRLYGTVSAKHNK